MARTRNWLWHDPRPEDVAQKIARDCVAKHKGEIRRAKRPCPACKSKSLLFREGPKKKSPYIARQYQEGNLWCPSCGLMVPAGCIISAKTRRKVKF